jgi:hypothetical protein
MPTEEIRVINGVTYKVIKEPCRCMCHSAPKGFVKHVRACCNNGYKETLIRMRGVGIETFVSKTTEEQRATIEKELDDVNQSIDNYFEADNAEFFGEEYYRNLMNRKEELEERLSKI